MKKVDAELDDELRPEYSVSVLRDGVRGKYTAAYKVGTNLALLAPDVAEAFPDDKSVNDALRLLMRIAKTSARSPRQRHARTRLRGSPCHD